MSNVVAQIYSRQTGLELLAGELSANLQPIDKLRVYLAICHVERFARYVPAGEEFPCGTELLLAMCSEVEEQYSNDPEDAFLELKRLEAECSLTRMEIEFFLHRGAFENSPDSYEGMRYQMEKTLRRPISSQENLELRRLSKRLAGANVVLKQKR